MNKTLSSLLMTAAVVLSAATPAAAAPATAAPVIVAKYSFDAAAATVNDLSGRGVPLKMRAADGGAVKYVAHGDGKALTFPARCADNATKCARVLLEGQDDPDLDPGTKAFSFGLSLAASAAAVGSESNLLQKGVADAQGQWKLQIGGKKKLPSCVVAGAGKGAKRYIAKSSAGVLDNKWHTVTCQRTATQLIIWVDGQNKGSVAVPSTVSIANNLPLRVGAQNLNAKKTMFGGAIDDVTVSLG
ncbi:LamG-like jellyroll fold domain-containing protein [Catenuloplanes sp. NPDC051500]|uniref:LamG-like jellyroll fold domain-containing protein n=1 Tax=Catenuloplanes sp. NPDC051500 TaxID=3363959 RepID=UPI0037B1CFCA